MEYRPEERKRLAEAMRLRVEAVRAVRKVVLPRELQPAIVFDPHLPGVEYPPQQNRIELRASYPGPLPDDEAEIAYAPATSLGRWIRSGQLTSRRLTEIYLSRIRRIGDPLKCYTTVTEEVARAQADARDRELAQGYYRGPLHGVPYSIKDVFDTAGIPTTWGAALFRDRVPAADAAIVEMLRDAGAVLLGKAATAELANGAEWFGGIGRNPWNPAEPARGSSTGSGAAVAAGLCAFSIGTDSLGSILIPADRCGVVGLRATFGRVPTRGAMPLTPSLDRIGPLCRTVEDAALVLAAINGPDPTSATSVDMGFFYNADLDLRSLRVGYSPRWFESHAVPQIGSASDAHRHALSALQATGVELVTVELPSLPFDSLIENLFVEAAAVFEDLTLTNADDALVNQQGWPLPWRRARLLSAVDYVQAERLRRYVMVLIHDLFTSSPILN